MRGAMLYGPHDVRNAPVADSPLRIIRDRQAGVLG